ncbi:MAG: trypsin-like serine protease [Oscillatoriales cyanobacterium RM2_1_1]|nr:trypsin-like serine protease [Oscillatoriales cyanobacterium SM2_3_0]NJO45323.1 trypsin-like serine protease [Oscillatoriales cyanobacterium RM2_1_1]
MGISEGKSFSWQQIGSYLATVVVSVGLTLASFQVFPGLSAIARADNSGGVPTLAQVTEPLAVSPARAEVRNFVTAAVNRVGPAVVRIDTERTITRDLDPFFDDPFFRRFFGEERMPQAPREYRQQGQGSGFIVDSSGIILTNAHVVKGADRVTVVLRDGRQFEGVVRGADEPSDLAVVKIEGTNLPVAPLGDSKQVQVGDWAIALGNPLGLDNTVTLGIVSTLNRSSAQVGIPDKRLDFIQTDAAINPGNSGGPLLNDRGEVIGINTAIRADGQGIGFAIPIDTASDIKDQLARGEKIPHPFIGIRMLSLTPEAARRFNDDPNSPFLIPEVEGVLVMQVIPDSPAAASGIRRGDVITQINGETLKSAEQLQNLVERSRIGQPLKITVRRGSETQQFSVRPGELQDAAAQR